MKSCLASRWSLSAHHKKLGKILLLRNRNFIETFEIICDKLVEPKQVEILSPLIPRTNRRIQEETSEVEVVISDHSSSS